MQPYLFIKSCSVSVSDCHLICVTLLNLGGNRLRAASQGGNFGK